MLKVRSSLFTLLILTVFAIVSLADEKQRVIAEKNIDPDHAVLEQAVMAALQKHNVPGTSIAVFDNYKIVWAKGFGLRESDKTLPVTSGTLFSVGSISKPATATIVMRLAQEKLLDLNADINSYLKSWRLPRYSEDSSSTVTMTHLLSHTAGTTVHGFKDYYQGQQIPTLVQLLSGQSPSQSPAISVNFKPGSQWQYSGGGYLVVYQALEDQFGDSFENLAQKYLFGPLNLSHSTFYQPGSEGFPTNIVSAHDTDGKPLGGRYPVSPELTAAGLWSTASDLALMIIDMQKSLAGQQAQILSKESAEKMLQLIRDGFGIGWKVGELFGAPTFYHGGANDGVGGFVMGFVKGGRGAVILTNGAYGSKVVSDVSKVLRQEFGW